MAEFKVTPEKLRSSSSNIKTISTNFTSTMASIETEMNNMKKKWESDAANTFINKFLGLKDNFEAYNKVINSYANFLEQAAKAYDAADKEIKKGTGNLFS